MLAKGATGREGPGLLSKSNDKIYISEQRFYNMASDWLMVVWPTNQMPGLKIYFDQHGFNHGYFLAILLPDVV